VVAAVGTWALTEYSHRKHSREAAGDKLDALRRTEQVKALVELQRLVLAYYESFSEHLWVAWEISERRFVGRQLQIKGDQSWSERERIALRLFAVAARVDDLKIRSKVDYLEEIARDAGITPGEHIAGPESRSRSSENVLKDDQRVQGTAIVLNLEIGDRLLELVGTQNPELALPGAPGSVDA